MADDIRSMREDIDLAPFRSHCSPHMTTRIITQSQVKSLMNMETAVAAVEKAFKAHGLQQTVMPSKVYLTLDKYEGDFRAMPSYMDGSAGIKWVNAHPNNPQKFNLPTVMASYILNDPANAKPLAFMDATLITAFRTGAAGGVASKYLANKPKKIGFVGAGVQAHYLLQAHQVVFGNNFEIVVADRAEQAAEAFADQVGGKSVTVEQACAADIVCTATPSRSPVVKRAWIHAGTHINAMGADAEGKQELDPAILRDGQVFLDDVEQGSHSGEINVPLHKGDYSIDQVTATLGETIAETKPGRAKADSITIFDSTGLAVQDLALAHAIYLAAEKNNIGTTVDLLG